jgi:hypothetical protein
MRRHPEEAHAPVANIYPPFVPFRDAGYGPNTYATTLLDCLHGLHKAMVIGLVDIKAIDPITTDFYERVENGDLNWFGRKFLALASPKDERRLCCWGGQGMTLAWRAWACVSQKAETDATARGTPAPPTTPHHTTQEASSPGTRPSTVMESAACTRWPRLKTSSPTSRSGA